ARNPCARHCEKRPPHVTARRLCEEAVQDGSHCTPEQALELTPGSLRRALFYDLCKWHPHIWRSAFDHREQPVQDLAPDSVDHGHGGLALRQLPMVVVL